MTERPDWAPAARGTEALEKWRRQMRRWTFDRLDECEAAAAKADPEAVRWMLDAARARASVRAALTQFPHLGVLAKSKRGRGRHQRPAKLDVSATARWAAATIRREIWPQHFGRLSGRGLGCGLTAEDLAAAWVGAKVSAISWKLPGRHKRGAPRKPRAKKPK
jgi:hypothetical protein